MSYRLKIEPRSKYLYFYVEGKTDYETGVALWREIGKKCDELDFELILVDENLTGQVTIQEMVRITSQFKEFGLLGKKIAFVDRDISHEEGNELGEIIARSSGIDILGFSNQEEATTWLLNEV